MIRRVRVELELTVESDLSTEALVAALDDEVRGKAWDFEGVNEVEVIDLWEDDDHA